MATSWINSEWLLQYDYGHVTCGVRGTSYPADSTYLPVTLNCYRNTSEAERSWAEVIKLPNGEAPIYRVTQQQDEWCLLHTMKCITILEEPMWPNVGALLNGQLRSIDRISWYFPPSFTSTRIVFGAKLGHLRFPVGLCVRVAAGSHPFMDMTLATRTKGLGSLAATAESKGGSPGGFTASLQCSVSTWCSSSVTWTQLAAFHRASAWTKNIQGKRNANT